MTEQCMSCGHHHEGGIGVGRCNCGCTVGTRPELSEQFLSDSHDFTAAVERAEEKLKAVQTQADATVVAIQRMCEALSTHR